MKTYYTKLVSVALAVCTAMSFAACGDDDDDDKGGGSVKGGTIPTPVLTDNSGNSIRVMGVGNLWFEYDDNGKLASFGDYDTSYQIEGSTFAFSDEDGEYNIGIYTSNNLITKIVAKANYTEDGEKYSEDMTINYDYNSNKQLTSASATGSGTETEYGVTVKYSGKATVSYTWSNNNLTKCVVNSTSTWKAKGYSESEKDLITYTISYGNQRNAFRQFPYFFDDLVGTGDFGGILSVVGLYGVGPAYFPTEITEEEVEEETEDGETETHTYTDTHDLSYSLNSDGSIDREIRNSYYYVDYHYSTVRSLVENNGEKLIPAVKSMFKQFHKNKQ